VAINIKKKFLPVRNRSYLNRDFDSIRAQLVDYAQIFFPDRISDFSEASVGGMFLDFASFVGDNLSFYLDHQFSELNIETAVESQNIERMLRTAGVQIAAASPAVAWVEFTINVPAEKIDASYFPKLALLPVIVRGTIVTSQDGIDFELTEDINFAGKDTLGNFIATSELSTTSADGTPTSFNVKMAEFCISGKRATQKFTFANTFVPFRSITLSNAGVTEVISVKDTNLNQYYEVQSLTQDNVFVAMTNANIDRELVKENLELKPAPYRFVSEVGFSSKKTKLKFGSGDANTLDDDIVPDPSQFAVPLYGKRTMTRFSIDPNDLLKTRTLGVSPQNTTLTVEYRYGGGLNHNVPAKALQTITMLKIRFLNGGSSNGMRSVRASMKATNPNAAGGGENAPTLNELKMMIPSARNSQSRIVTKEDLLARVYTMPSNFGRVYRASVRSNPINPLSTQLFIISRNMRGSLTISPDALKKNLVKYLNEYRMISDAVDILDAAVVNIQVRFSVTVDPNANKTAVIQDAIAQITNYFKINNFQIDQVIPISDLQNILFNVRGVITITDLKLYSLSGNYKGRPYAETSFDVAQSTIKGLIVPPIGGIFEVKYPTADIIGSAN